MGDEKCDTTELIHTGDMVQIDETEDKLQQNVEIYVKEISKTNVESTTEKIKAMQISTKTRKHRITIQE